MKETPPRKTKIIATLGPATDTPELIGRLADAGVNIFRLNMSHATHEWIRRMVTTMRAAGGASQKFIGIVIDTQGPAIRTRELPVSLVVQPAPRFMGAL